MKTSDNCVGCNESQSKPHPETVSEWPEGSTWKHIVLPESPGITRHICPLCAHHVALTVLNNVPKVPPAEQSGEAAHELIYQAVRELMDLAVTLDQEIDADEQAEFRAAQLADFQATRKN